MGCFFPIATVAIHGIMQFVGSCFECLIVCIYLISAKWAHTNMFFTYRTFIKQGPFSTKNSFTILMFWQAKFKSPVHDCDDFNLLRSVCDRRSQPIIQGLLWVWAQPMRDDVTRQRRLSVAEPILTMIPVYWLKNDIIRDEAGYHLDKLSLFKTFPPLPCYISLKIRLIAYEWYDKTLH